MHEILVDNSSAPLLFKVASIDSMLVQSAVLMRASNNGILRDAYMCIVVNM